MPSQINRRRFLQLAGGSIASTMLSDSIARAASIPAHRATKSLEDIEHIVVLMQENRSFDHYFGTMRGVRGFGDPHPVTLPSGHPVWHQADKGTTTLPFRPDVGNLALTFIEDLDHSWDGTHEMFNDGNWDQWIPAKTTTSMAHMRRSDLPFHYALADAFTVCDGYHCSMLGPTDTNRYYMWTGWDGNNGKGGGPVVANDELGYSWQTYPERLQAAGVSWKIYQDVGTGLDAAGGWGFASDPYIGNYGDTSLLYFDNYRNAVPGSPLYERARTGTDVGSGSGTFFDVLADDVKTGKLPSVSWIVAPEAYTEHPAWPAGYGAWYTAGVLNALTSDPKVWAKTALLITFDENDGFFDHLPGPYPNVGGLPGHSTVPLTDEMFHGTAGTPGGSPGTPGPYGLGVRVPLLVVSPWSTGGWVCSETFDHTSLIRFIEARFKVNEPHITPWRRTVCGDLTSAFDFSGTHDAMPKLPNVAAYEPDTEQPTPPSYHPVPPASGAVPRQERGTRPSRRLGYRFDVQITRRDDGLALTITNVGHLGIGLQARSQTIAAAPLTYTVGAGHELSTLIPSPAVYDLSVHGPNGFYRHVAGAGAASLQVVSHADPASGILTLTLTARRPVTVEVADAHGRVRTMKVDHRPARLQTMTARSGGWYDLALTIAGDRHFAYDLGGRIESRAQLTSDPQLGG